MNKHKVGKEQRWMVTFMPVIVILLVVLTGLVYGVGARNFWQGFTYTFLTLASVKLGVIAIHIGVRHLYTQRKGNTKREGRAWEENRERTRRRLRSSIEAAILVSAIVGGMIQLCI